MLLFVIMRWNTCYWTFYLFTEILVEYISKVASAAPNTPFYYYCINFFTGVYRK